jgi:hypothetical protein
MATKSEVFKLVREHIKGQTLTGRGITLEFLRSLLREKGVIDSNNVILIQETSKKRSPSPKIKSPKKSPLTKPPQIGNS